MAQFRNRERRAGRVLALATLAAAAGCVPSETVRLDSKPDGATLTLFKVNPQGQESAVPLDHPQAPTSVALQFDKDVHYRVEAHRALCSPNKETVIRLDNQTEYTIPLTPFKLSVAGIAFVPTKTGDAWQLRPVQTQTTASLDTAEPSLTYVDQPVPLTTNTLANTADNTVHQVDYPSITVSPTAGVMVYEEARSDSSAPGGFASKLYKLPLTSGENATLLTLSRKQQHFPAFDYSGDEVLFDSSDDSRTESPFHFRAADNEASIGRLEHDADTCEIGFSAGRDALAFTSYGPNSPGPQVEVAARDGTGPTIRATGMSPQLSPDGNHVLYIHKPEAGGHYRLSTVNVRGPIATREIVQNEDYDYRDPHWSPDGQLIVYCTSRRSAPPVDLQKEPDPQFRESDDTHSFLWVVTADGRNPIQLTHNESFDSDPVFDRNGRTIYFRSNRGGAWNVWKLNLTDAAFASLKVQPPQ